MDAYRIELHVDGKRIIIELPYFNQKFIKIDNYAPFPKNDKGMGLVVTTAISDFETDIKGLIPKTLEGNPFDNSVECLFQVVQKHIETYGRLMPSDLYTYINESILLILTISDQLLNEKSTRTDGEDYFVVLFKIIWNAFPNEMKEQYYKFAMQDPMTNYILRLLI